MDSIVCSEVLLNFGVPSPLSISIFSEKPLPSQISDVWQLIQHHYLHHNTINHSLHFHSPQQSPDAVLALVHHHRVPDFVQLCGGCQPCRTTADDRDAFAGPRGRLLGLDPIVQKGVVDDRAFNTLDCHRRGADTHAAGTLIREGKG